AEAGVLVTAARSLADAREFLRRSPLRGAEPWGRVRLVAHGSQWQGLRVPVFADGELATLQALERTLARDEFPPLPAELLDRDSRLVVDSCGLARRPRWLQRLAELFAGPTRVPVEASAGYVWYRRLRDADGRLQSRREELPYRAAVIAGAQSLDEDARRRLRRGWPAERVVEVVAVPVRIDVPAPAIDGRGPSASPEALAAVRNYGLRWSQLQWRADAGRLHGTALIAVAAPDLAAEELRELAAAVP
uniref:hypothetical protein n=1 Tax=Tahibacter caeni TaxID=1453545 RepID=UPI002147DD98